ncbi:MAG: hypothetical protein QGH45_06170 [Myxococcota bacterium]|jgi:hypothetical protein|nr:hypothetical protein [Myxococcota bacterium]
MIGLLRRRPAIELDDLERAARVTLLRLGERAPAGAGDDGEQNARGTRVSLRLNHESLAAIGLPRTLVAGDLQRSLDEWASLELPSRTPVDVELVPDRSLTPGDVRVWFGDGRPRPATPVTAAASLLEVEGTGRDEAGDPETGDAVACPEEAEPEVPAGGKRDRIGATRRPRARKRGYSAMAVLAPRSNARRIRRKRMVVLLAVLVAALCWYLVGPALADTYAAPGPAPDVVLVDGSPATPEGGWGGLWPWLAGAALATAALTGLGLLGMAALGALRRQRRVRSPSAETFPPTMAHQAVSEGTRDRADAQADAGAMLTDLRRVRDVADVEGWTGVVDDAMAIEKDLHWIRQKLAFAPAGRLAAARGNAVDVGAVIEADQGAAGALTRLGEELQVLRQRARGASGSSLVVELASLRQRAGDLRGMIARRPAMIID